MVSVDLSILIAYILSQQLLYIKTNLLFIILCIEVSCTFSSRQISYQERVRQVNRVHKVLEKAGMKWSFVRSSMMGMSGRIILLLCAHHRHESKGACRCSWLRREPTSHASRMASIAGGGRFISEPEPPEQARQRVG